VPGRPGQVLRSTVELDPKTAYVIQHRGVGNAPPPVENTKVLGHALELWLNAEHNRRDMQALEAGLRDEPARHGNPVPADLHARIARDLGWSVADTYKFSLPTLRELVRDDKLREEVTQVLVAGHHLSAAAPKRRRRST